MTQPEPEQRVVWATAPSPLPPIKVKPRRWVVAVVVAWAAVLIVGFSWTIWHGEPTDRSMTTVAQALPTVDRATTEVLRAATSDGQAVAILGGLTKVADCSVTPFRSGARYERAVTLLVPEGTEQALLGRVRDRLPADYHASVRTGSRPRLTADAGFYVAILGTIDAPGTVLVAVDTGDCRVVGDLPATSAPPVPTTAGETPLAAVVRELGTTPSSWRVVAVPCPGGGTARTISAESDAGATPLNTALATTPGQVVVSSPDAFAVRADGVGIAVRNSGPSTLFSATTACP